MRHSGGLPVVWDVGPDYAESELAAAASRFDGLLLTGGGDIAPELFGESPVNDTLEIDAIRDRAEIGLIHAFCAERKPIFGICRGVQILNVACGGDLWQDLPAQRGVDHRDTTHEVIVTDGRMRGLFGEQVTVNSFHHQAVRSPAPGFAITAKSPDGIVEAIEHENGLWWGVQWHPERMEGMGGVFGMFIELLDFRKT